MVANKILNEIISIEDAAQIIKLSTGKFISQDQVRHLCQQGKLAAKKICGIWIVVKESAENYKRQPPGPKRRNDDDIRLQRHTSRRQSFNKAKG